MSLRAINNHILFKFVDEINNLNNQFAKGKTASGIILVGDTFDESAKKARWIEIQHVGPGVKTVSAGQTVLVPALRWTEGVKVNGAKLWRTDESELVAVLEGGNYARPLSDWVLFTALTTDHVRKQGDLIVVGGIQDTPKGISLDVGPDVSEVPVDAHIFYDGKNFTNYARVEGSPSDFAFIREADILACSKD